MSLKSWAFAQVKVETHPLGVGLSGLVTLREQFVSACQEYGTGLLIPFPLFGGLQCWLLNRRERLGLFRSMPH